MESADLRVFASVARLGGMNRAAAELNTVQSNVTARVRLLEEQLGQKLFLRHSRGVALTPAGQRLLPYALKVGQLLEDAKRAVRDDGAPSGLLTIGSLETTAALRLSPLLAAYARAWPDVDLVLRTGTTCELVDAVLDRRVEGAFVCGPVNHPELEVEPVFREELVVVSGPDADLNDLLARPDLKILVLRAGCSYRQRLEEILARRGMFGLRCLEFGTLEAILGCAAAGIGITLLPRVVAEPVWRQGRIGIHVLSPNDAQVDTLFIRRRDGFLSSALATLLNHVRPAYRRPVAAE